jgi:hypothetical protein
VEVGLTLSPFSFSLTMRERAILFDKDATSTADVENPLLC